MRLLVVEDDASLRTALVEGLGYEGFAVDACADGASALEAVDINSYDVLVLDRDLPGVHGDEVCRRIVGQEGAPAVLMLTAAGSLPDKVAGFGMGADDYMAKPFEFLELVVRIRALGRRGSPRPPVLSRHGVVLDIFTRRVMRDGMPVRLTPKEMAVLEVLMGADGGVVSAETLLEKAWDENANPFTNSTRVTMSSLRRKLGIPWVIETVPGSGYRMVAE